MRLKHYCNSYLTTHAVTDDSPLYIFDAMFGEHREARQILADYTVPQVEHGPCCR